jgi:hypothetical protein
MAKLVIGCAARAVLRWKPSIKRGKDCGKEPARPNAE